MGYRQLGEPTFTCPKCKREYSLNDAQAQYGLWQGKVLARCSVCFEKIKHAFWLRQMGEEDNDKTFI